MMKTNLVVAFAVAANMMLGCADGSTDVEAGDPPVGADLQPGDIGGIYQAINQVDCAGRNDFASVEFANGRKQCWANGGTQTYIHSGPRRLCTGNNDVTFYVLRNAWDACCAPHKSYVPRWTCIDRDWYSLQKVQIH
jgi:hypothetical protein